MPRRAIPGDVLRTAREHARQEHAIVELPVSKIGATTAPRATITWRESEDGPLVRCRLCPPGFDRYYAELYATRPPERLLALIADHFVTRHGGEIPDDEIFCEEGEAAKAKAVWLPAVPERGAGIVCRSCPEGMNQVFLSEPAYGDARRLWLLRARRLWDDVRGLGPKEQAEYLEALDRGLLSKRRADEARCAIRRTKEGEREAEDPLEAALRRILVRRVRGGERITAVVRELASADAVRFACAVGPEIPELAAQVDRWTTKSAPGLLATFLGLPPGRHASVRERKLWDVWALARGRPAAHADL